MTSGTTNQRSRAQRHPRADGERTRGAILRAAASLATIEGLDGLSIGHLADAIGMSKSGLYAHFGSKQELHLATAAGAERIFRAEVIAPALAARPGRSAPPPRRWPAGVLAWSRSARIGRSYSSRSRRPGARSTGHRALRWWPVTRQRAGWRPGCVPRPPAGAAARGCAGS